MLTVKGQGTATVERSGCVNDADNLDPIETSDISIPTGDIEYQIVDGVLTILNTVLEGTFTQ